MSQEDQDALAAQWAAALEEDDGGGDALGGADAAPAAAGSAQDDEALAAQWAEALAADEEANEDTEKDSHKFIIAFFEIICRSDGADFRIRRECW